MATREERDLVLRHAGFQRKVRDAILDDGGSAFTHLIEDAGNADVVDGTGALITDLGIVVSADGSTFAETFLVLNPGGKINAYVDPDADGAYTLRRQGDDTNLFRINTDGSMHWGDGTNPPDLVMSRDDSRGLGFMFRNAGFTADDDPAVFFYPSNAGGNYATFVVAAKADFSGDYTQVDSDAVYLSAAGHSLTLAVDADGDLTVNDVKVQLQA